MDIKKLKLVYFSPTETSKKTVEAVAEGIGIDYEPFDLTPPDAETSKHKFASEDLVIFGAPVYGGRIPLTAVNRIKNLNGNGTLAVLIVLYGNRAFEDALLELKDLTLELGFKPVAGAAFIGEHSYDTVETPIATGRPDKKDLDKAKMLGEKVKAKLDSITGETLDLKLPGNHPYRERGLRDPSSPETDVDTCILCGTCERICPTAAVTVIDVVETVKENCIRCTACVKNCLTGARHWEDEGIKKAAMWLHTNFSDRKEPEIFL